MVDTWSEVVVQTWAMKRNIIKEHRMFYLAVHVHCSVPQHPMCQFSSKYVASSFKCSLVLASSLELFRITKSVSTCS